MASTNDWAAQAAHYIFKETVMWNWQEHWHPRKMSESEARIAAIITEHDPFKQGTAYMPVPRCKTCAHLLPDKRLSLSQQIGECTVIWINDGKTKLRLSVAADFGCVEWKEK